MLILLHLVQHVLSVQQQVATVCFVGVAAVYLHGVLHQSCGRAIRTRARLNWFYQQSHRLAVAPIVIQPRASAESIHGQMCAAEASSRSHAHHPTRVITATQNRVNIM